MMEVVRKVGDEYPPLRFEDMDMPVDLTGCQASYVFRSDGDPPTRLAGDLAILDGKAGMVEAPNPPVPGTAEITLRFPTGECETLMTTVRWVR
jgi:hypothetical protein